MHKQKRLCADKERTAEVTHPEICTKGQRSRWRGTAERKRRALPLSKDLKTGRESLCTFRNNTDLCNSEVEPAKQPWQEPLEMRYEKGVLLGQGAFGSVYAGIRRADGLPVALKYVTKDQEDEEKEQLAQGGSVPQEVALLQRVTEAPASPHIAGLIEWRGRPSCYTVVLERPEPCQDLDAYCRDQGGVLREALARPVLAQLLRALLHCQERGVLHRDVKPDNLLIQTSTLKLKLIDFGCGDLVKDTPYKRFAGTPHFSPPEVFLQKEYLAGPCTVWSVGVTLYKVVCGHLPFTNIWQTAKGKVNFTRALSPELRHVIRQCLKRRAEDRSTLEQLQRHPWLHPVSSVHPIL
ncbi:serine/threonine-protein kinase pim-1 [Megalops cyprinoides]|uniref:serine/threonine-protein kinase pim-1 n=1 Tax=Megalops cyprinoides TaxID=118141 RepID=UPI0018655F4D|nr:serine/threonine-protein kinase pim-1 [Megalops cyprinoides]